MRMQKHGVLIMWNTDPACENEHEAHSQDFRGKCSLLCFFFWLYMSNHNIGSLMVGHAVFFPQTCRRTAYHYIKKKKWDKNPYKTHPLTPLCSKQTGAPLTHKVGDLNPKLTPIQPQGKEVIDTSCPCQAPIKKFLTSEQQSSS